MFSPPRPISFIVTVLVLIAAGVAGYLYFASPPNDNSLKASGSFKDSPNGSSKSTPIISNNTPVVVNFVGDLAVKGNPENDGALEPFVVGEILKLEANALNAVEYRWTINGEPLKEKGAEWSALPERIFEVVKPGEYTFAVQVRGADKNQVSQEKKTSITFPPLKILKLTTFLGQNEDEHFVTGETLHLQAEMARQMIADLDFYRFRYSINETPIKHPDDNEEWTTSDTLSYVFATPGHYTFKVEARRATEPKAEDTMELPGTVVAADAVVTTLDSNPPRENGAPVGSQVSLSSFTQSRFGNSECRFGVKPLNAADFNWLSEDSGAIWGGAYRSWVPVEPGTYLVRCEVRELGKPAADDFREMVFTVIDANF